MREFNVRNSLAGKSILITGASGFVGKVLVEKLLRDCKRIDKVFVLFRGKKANDLVKRFDDFKKCLAFQKIREKCPEMLDKLNAVNGDLMLPNVGISDQDIEILKTNVNFVYHCAASVRFDDSLKVAVSMNLIGTRSMLDLAAKFDNLEAFVHVSTAFSNTDLKVVHEKVYEPIISYTSVIEACEMNSDIIMDAIMKKAMKTFPNTYVFSKNLAEKLVWDRRAEIPVAIVRPSVVCPSYKEPMPGWVDSINGPMGVLLGASSGLLRTVHGDGAVTPDLIPVDFAANAIIAAGTALSSNPIREAKVYNCCSSARMPIKWNDFLDLGREVSLL